MAQGWTISPTEGGASINSNGEATFPPNGTSGDIVYTITYEDANGCTGNTTYTVPACPPTPCSSSSFTVTEIESEFCDAVYSSQTIDCDGKIIVAQPDCTYDSNVLKVTASRVTEGSAPPFKILGWKFIIQVDRDKVTPGNTVPSQTVTFTATIDGNQVSSSVTVVNGCCFDYPSASRPIAKPSLADDYNKNFITIGMTIVGNGGTPAILPNAGTASYTYEIEWESESTSCPTQEKTTGTFSGGIGDIITINRPPAFDCLYKVKSFTTSVPTGNFKGRDCVTYIYRTYQSS